MSDTQLVLRTVYLSPKIDEELKNEAFSKNVSKNELIRKYIVAGMKAQKAVTKEPKKVLPRKLKAHANSL